MAINDDYIWVSLDYANANQVAGWRGRMDRHDFEAIVEGAFTLPFVALEHVHWVETIWNEAERQNKLKLSVYGVHGVARFHKGTIYLRPEHIANLAPLHDCTDLIRGGERFLDEQ